MIEVFATNIPNKKQAEKIVKNLNDHLPGLMLNYDIENPIINYPCDHSILRVEGEKFDSDNVITLVTELGFSCHVLEDKICNK